MELRQLEDHIRTLATVEEAESPLISCYLDLSKGVIGCRDELEARFQILRKSLPVRSGAEFGESADRIAAYLNESLSERTRGLAVFARGGPTPFWLPLQFEVPLPNWIAVGSTPNIYHLVERWHSALIETWRQAPQSRRMTPRSRTIRSSIVIPWVPR